MKRRIVLIALAVCASLAVLGVAGVWVAWTVVCRSNKCPSLAGLDRWERMPHTVDFRSYYASIIDGWLGGGSVRR